MSIHRDFLNAVCAATKQRRLLWSEKEPGQFVAEGFAFGQGCDWSSCANANE